VTLSEPTPFPPSKAVWDKENHREQMDREASNPLSLQREFEHPWLELFMTLGIVAALGIVVIAAIVWGAS
jgi:hypothetical protein